MKWESSKPYANPRFLVMLTDSRLKPHSVPKPLGFYLGLIHTALGENDKAIDWLEKASETRLGLLNVISTDPTFAALRSDPHFPSLLRRMNFLE